MSMFVKVHKSYRTVVAICDSSLIGKKFQEEIKLLDIRENFFKGEEMDKQQTQKIIRIQAREDATFNIVGEESVQTAIDSEIIDENSISRIQNIPYALKLL